MVFRVILRYLMNNEHLINKLADSKPIRRAAQLMVYLMHRTSALNQTYRISDNPKELANQLRDIVKRFSSNLRKEIEDAKEEMKKKQQK